MNARAGQENVVKFLLKNGADANIKSSKQFQYSPFTAALRSGKIFGEKKVYIEKLIIESLFDWNVDFKKIAELLINDGHFKPEKWESVLYTCIVPNGKNSF